MHVCLSAHPVMVSERVPVLLARLTVTVPLLSSTTKFPVSSSRMTSGAVSEETKN